jgi:hypothetical protein
MTPFRVRINNTVSLGLMLQSEDPRHSPHGSSTFNGASLLEARDYRDLKCQRC